MNRNRSDESLDNGDDRNTYLSSPSSSSAASEDSLDGRPTTKDMYATRHLLPSKQKRPFRSMSTEKSEGDYINDVLGLPNNKREQYNSNLRKSDYGDHMASYNNENKPQFFRHESDYDKFLNERIYYDQQQGNSTDEYLDWMKNNNWQDPRIPQKNLANTSNANNMYIDGEKRPDQFGSSLELFMKEQNLFKSSKQVWFQDNKTGGFSETLMLCSQLYHCPTLYEALMLVDKNRDLIRNLIKPIVEAPAFRNYDMSLYKIDNSVKESFNPNFWLDREPVVTTADGNCQYHAVSISLTGTETYTPEVRLATAVAVLDNRDWFESVLRSIDRGSVLDLLKTIVKSFSWGDETTLKAIAIAIKRRIYLYTCNIGKKDYEIVQTLTKEELLNAFREKKYKGGTGIHAYANPLVPVSSYNYIMLFHKSEHFIAVLPYSRNPVDYEPYNPIVPDFV